MDRVGTMFCVPGEEPRFSPPTKMVVTGPIKGRATDAIRREIGVFKEALNAAGGAEEAFICVFAPGWLDHHIFDEYYGDDEEFVFALADALREEYRAVVDAGFILQIDDPGVATSWDMIKPEPTVAEYRRLSENPHRCAQPRARRLARGSRAPPFLLGQLAWRAHPRPAAARTSSISCFEVRAQCYSFEAGNVRHEHEWTIWKDVKLPAGKIIMPGVVSHATNIVEHPELIARRIRNFAEAVGTGERDRAAPIAGSARRLHDDLVWAKLSALAEGARLASKALWAR